MEALRHYKKLACNPVEVEESYSIHSHTHPFVRSSVSLFISSREPGSWFRSSPHLHRVFHGSNLCLTIVLESQRGWHSPTEEEDIRNHL